MTDYVPTGFHKAQIQAAHHKKGKEILTVLFKCQEWLFWKICTLQFRASCTQEVSHYQALEKSENVSYFKMHGPHVLVFLVNLIKYYPYMET